MRKMLNNWTSAICYHNIYMCSTCFISMEDSTEKYIRWSENCVWQTFGDTVTILDLSQALEPSLIPTEEKKAGIRLNPVGKDVWDLCDGTRTLKGIINQLFEEYEGDPEKIRKDVEGLISNLKERGLLTYEDTPKEYKIIEVPSEKYLVWHDNVLWNEVEGQVIAMNNETGMSFEFTPELGEIWKLCDGKNPVRKIFAALEEKGIINEKQPSSAFRLLFKQFLMLGMVALRDEPV